MQSNDPILALLGLFILSTTFFFCGKEVVTSAPPAALESQTTIPLPVPNIGAPPLSSPTAPTASEAMGLSGKIGEQLIRHSSMYRINSTPLLTEKDTLSNRVATMSHEDLTVNVGGHRDNLGLGYEHEVLSEQHVQADAEDLLSRRGIVDQLTSSGFQMSGPVAWRLTDEWRWQNGAKGEQP